MLNRKLIKCLCVLTLLQGSFTHTLITMISVVNTQLINVSLWILLTTFADWRGGGERVQWKRTASFKRKKQSYAGCRRCWLKCRHRCNSNNRSSVVSQRQVLSSCVRSIYFFKSLVLMRDSEMIITVSYHWDILLYFIWCFKYSCESFLSAMILNMLRYLAGKLIRLSFQPSSMCIRSSCLVGERNCLSVYFTFVFFIAFFVLIITEGWHLFVKYCSLLKWKCINSWIVIHFILSFSFVHVVWTVTFNNWLVWEPSTSWCINYKKGAMSEVSLLILLITSTLVSAVSTLPL